MLLVKSYSTEKLTRSQPIRIKECPKSEGSNMRKRDCNRLKSQPVRILQLIKQDEERKSSVRKKILPERLGQLSSKKHTSTKKQCNGQIHDTKHSYNHVRRNLNFNNISIDNGKNEKKSEDCSTKSTFSSIGQTCNEVSEPTMRKSLLLKPNTIKNKHLQTCTNKVYKYSKIPEASKENVDTCSRSKLSIHSGTNKNKNSLLLNNDLYSKYNSDNSTESESKITSKKCKTVENVNYSGLNIVDTNFVESCEISDTKHLQVPQSTIHQQIVNNKNQLCMQNNIPQEVSSLEYSNLKCEKSEVLKDQDKCIEDLCNDFQSTKMTLLENNLNVKYTSSEMIYVDKKEITRLKCELEDLVNTTEENLNKLKSTLTNITRLLSAPNEAVLKFGTSKEKEGNTKSMLDKEVQVGICCKIIQSTDANLQIPDICISNENIHDDKFENTACSDVDESFLNLENQLNIMPVKDIGSVKKQLFKKSTPVVIKYRQKRSLKEYMTLKSSMSFLKTPDGKEFRSLCHKNNLDKSILSKTDISSKVLTDLHNLYSDSPEIDENFTHLN